jgi:exopolyphosphatase/guanosine-5'-triphosphate,3'-diphosphate pyrophosphatase
MAEKKNMTAAVIHLGSERVAMHLIQYSDLFHIKVIESAVQPVKLGEETFKTGRISSETILNIVSILKGFRRLMKDYRVRSYVMQATTAVREAENQRYFLDQVFVKTGFKIDVINMPREIYTNLASLLWAEGASDLKSVPREGRLIIDVSSGAVGFTYMVDGGLRYQQNLHIGPIRLKEYFTREERSSIHFEDALNEYIRARLMPAAQELQGCDIKELVLGSTEDQPLLRLLDGRRRKNSLIHFSGSELEALYQRVHQMTEQDLMKTCSLTQEETELVLPAAALYCQLASAVKPKQITVPTSRFIHGMEILYVAEQTDRTFIKMMHELQLSLISGIAERYHCDAVHTSFVEKLCSRFFNSLAPCQGLDAGERIYLRAAARLHGAGKYFSLRTQDLSSYQMIRTADLIGFSREEQQNIAEITYLYSMDSLRDRLPELMALDVNVTPKTAKLAAILSLADALDISSRQKITGCSTAVKDDRFRVKVKSREDLSLERWTFEKRSGFFEEVFGLRPVLEQEE